MSFCCVKAMVEEEFDQVLVLSFVYLSKYFKCFNYTFKINMNSNKDKHECVYSCGLAQTLELMSPLV